MFHVAPRYLLLTAYLSRYISFVFASVTSVVVLATPSSVVGWSPDNTTTLAQIPSSLSPVGILRASMYPLRPHSGYMEARNIPTGGKLLGICARVSQHYIEPAGKQQRDIPSISHRPSVIIIIIVKSTSLAPRTSCSRLHLSLSEPPPSPPPSAAAATSDSDMKAALSYFS